MQFDERTLDQSRAEGRSLCLTGVSLAVALAGASALSAVLWLLIWSVI